MPCRDVAAVVVYVCLLAGCSKSSPPSPTPGAGSGESITGRERLGWDQVADSSAELATLRYAIYVDGARSEIADVTCGATAGANGFPCSGRLPGMSNGSHVLELASFIDAGAVSESARSAPFRVTVTAVVAGPAGSLHDGDILTTADGVNLRADVLLDGFPAPTAVAVSGDGRAFVGTGAGLIVVKDGAMLGTAQLTDGAVLAIALSTTFDRDAHVYVIQVVSTETGARVFRTARFREAGGRLGERMVLLENGPPSEDPAAAIGFGPDGKLYVAFDDSGNAAGSDRMSAWSGKVLRMEPDGRTPEDQAAASPVLFRGLTSPRGFDWPRDGGAMWVADASRDGVERVRVITQTSARPRRAGQRETFDMPRGLGAAALTFYGGDMIREFSEDLLIAGRDAGYILRVRFDPNNRARPATTERLLEGRVDSVRALTIGPDGAIYFCTTTTLLRLARP